MRGLKSQDLLAITDFLYFGETNILQENLDSFLALAEELRLKGLTGTNVEEPQGEVEQTLRNTPIMKTETAKQSKTVSSLQCQTPIKFDTQVAVENSSISGSLQNLDEQIKSMMTMTDVKAPNGNGREYLATCNICGKQSVSKNMPNHIEAKHITGASHACNICGQTSRSRDGLRIHKRKYHDSVAGLNLV